MHIFLQGLRNIGKSTVIHKTIEILSMNMPLKLGGFFTWNGGEADPHVYMQSAQEGRKGEIYRVASWDKNNGGMLSSTETFDQIGVQMFSNVLLSDLIIMDELGFLESNAVKFKKAIYDTLTLGIPVLGVLRLGDVPWHAEIKRNPLVSLFDVSEENREELPGQLVKALFPTRIKD